MNFEWALTQMKRGLKVTRTEWARNTSTNPKLALYITERGNFRCDLKVYSTDRVMIPAVDILAVDWKLYE